jgi:hypothetical protein
MQHDMRYVNTMSFTAGRDSTKIIKPFRLIIKLPSLIIRHHSGRRTEFKMELLQGFSTFTRQGPHTFLIDSRHACYK